MPQYSLTHAQHDAFNFIKAYIVENDGVSPSYDEIRVAFGLKSKSGVVRLVEALKERGYIRCLPHTARSITLVDQNRFSECCGCRVKIAPGTSLIAAPCPALEKIKRWGWPCQKSMAETPILSESDGGKNDS